MPNEQEITGADTAALINGEGYTTAEKVLLASLLEKNDRVDIAIPDGMPAADLWQAFSMCASVYKVTQRATGQLKLLIGRALAVIQDTPEIYESRGFNSFDQFISNEHSGLPYLTGISRAELYKAKSVAKAVGPGMNLDDARDIGFSKMQLVAGYVKAEDSRFAPLMEHAKTDTIPQLRERIAREGLADKGDMEWDVIQFTATKNQARFIKAFMANPQVQAYCETNSPGVIIERAIAEVIGEWNIQGQVIEGQAQEV